VPLALANAAPAVGGGSSLAARKVLYAAPLPHRTVTSVVVVMSLQCVLGVPAAKPGVQLWALGVAWVRTSFEVAK